jgi:hypothetical protein
MLRVRKVLKKRRASEPAVEALFDPDWYRKQGGSGALAHYLDEGWRAGLDPNPAFSTNWYLKTYPDVASLDVCPLLHYVDHGAREGRAPSPLFDPQWYCERNQDVPLGEALSHYREVGWRAGSSPHPLFDVEWYQLAYPNACLGQDPLEHYFHGGWQEGHLPNPLFNPLWYHSQYPDSRWLEPLSHYLTFGRYKGYPPAPLFDEGYYRQINPTLKTDGNPLMHYLDEGWRAGYDPHPLFDGYWYSAQWPVDEDGTLLTSGISPLSQIPPIGHYLLYGLKSGYNPSPLFDAVWYSSRHIDVGESGLDPLEHYIRYGEEEGRPAFPRDAGINPIAPLLNEGSVSWHIPLAENLDGSNLVMLACHDQRKIYGVALRHMVSSYHRAGWKVLLAFDHEMEMSAFDQCSDDERPEGVLALPHGGYDFFSWRLMWEELSKSANPARVLLSNDSIIGPLVPLDPLMRLIEAHPADVLGFVESSENVFHLQSWGMVFQGRPLAEGALWRYLSQVKEGIEKQHLIGRMEVRLARWAAFQGYSVASLCSPVGQIDSGTNPSIFGWRRILGLGIPFIKRELFMLPPKQTRFLPADLIEELSEYTEWDVASLIADSLAQIGVSDRAPAISDWNH